MTSFQEDYCDREHRVITRTYASSFEDVIYCIRSAKSVEINVIRLINGTYQGTTTVGQFTKFDECGIWFSCANDGEEICFGDSYSDYIELL